MKKGCNYQGHEFGARDYPDSMCVRGRLYDADNCDGKGQLYEPAEYIPCPMCNREEAVRWKIGQMDEAAAYFVRRKRARAIMRARVAHFRQGERELATPTA